MIHSYHTKRVSTKNKKVKTNIVKMSKEWIYPTLENNQSFQKRIDLFAKIRETSQLLLIAFVEREKYWL